MTDDNIGKDTARDPERGASGPARGDPRAAAGRAAGKVAKKVVKKAGRKKAAKKAAATAGKTTRKTTGTATKRDKPAPPRATAPASGTTTARASAARPKAAARAAAPATGATAASGAAASGAAAAGAANAPDPGDGAAWASGAAAAEGAASTPAAPAAPPPHEVGPSMEAPRPPAPMHPGAYTDPAQEESGGLGSLLTIWGPLIIVGFLVLIFRGGVERGDTVVAAASDAPAPPAEAADPPAPVVREPQAGGAAAPAGARPPERAPGPPGAGRKVAEAFDRGFTMRASMAGGPAFADRAPGAPMPAGLPGRLYPSPPGPYRDPRYRGLPADERWPAAGDWAAWSAGAREDAGPENGGDAPAQWVRCAPPYYWCPAPANPTW